MFPSNTNSSSKGLVWPVLLGSFSSISSADSFLRYSWSWQWTLGARIVEGLGWRVGAMDLAGVGQLLLSLQCRILPQIILNLAVNSRCWVQRNCGRFGLESRCFGFDWCLARVVQLLPFSSAESGGGMMAGWGSRTGAPAGRWTHEGSCRCSAAWSGIPSAASLGT